MAKKNDIVRHTANQIKAKLKRGEDRTDWAKIAATTEAKLQASIAADPDHAPGEPDWTRAVIGVPPHKEHINIRVDHDVLEWFRARGRGYQTMMNNVLRAFVQTRRQSQTKKLKPKRKSAA
jgi:uncharacterized protein (DUF4415 family)